MPEPATVSENQPSPSDPTREHGPDPILGKVIDGCRIQRKLGQGGMGVVYLAEHDTLHQLFVIKILNPALVGAEDTVERFFREAQACAQLNHPGIVAIQNVGQEGEYYFIRMEYIEGKTLEDTIKEKNQFEWRNATQVIVDTADALSHAHQKGMIHRDIKPENIMITPSGGVKVMDFGLAKHVHSQAKVSVTGQIVGTPFFMSPEQAGGKPTDARSDIYSLGVTLYYMLTGVKPFNGKNLQEIFLKHFFYAPESPKIYNAELPEALCEIVKKCLKKKKKERYQSAKELVKDLRTVLDDPDARISAEAGPGDAPAAEPEGDFGKTIRAQQQQQGAEEGGSTMVAQADRTQVAGAERTQVAGAERTQVAGADRTAVADGGGTVRVNDDEGGATVRVRDGAGDDEKTLSVKPGGDGDQTVKVGRGGGDDEEDAHAGLDLPTSIINAAQGGGAATDAPKKTGGAIAASVSKGKLAAVAGIIAIPLLLLGANEVRASRAFDDLAERYNAITTGPLVDKDLDDGRQLVADLQDAPSGMFTDAARLEAMATTVKGLIEGEEKRREDDKRIKEDLDRKVRGAQEAEERKAARTAEARVKYDKIIKLRDVDKNLRLYTDEVLAFVREYADLSDLTNTLSIPVRVTSEPQGAEVFAIAEDGSEQPRGATPQMIWVRPNRDWRVKVRKHGFVEQEKSGNGTTFDEVEVVFDRKVLGERTLGEIQIAIGVRPRMEPITPSAQPAVDLSPTTGGDIFYVGHDGRLRAFNLKRGAPAWRLDPALHTVGLYGDPTPSPLVIPGQAIIVPSLLGRLSAHRPDGSRIWTIEVGAPVSSSPAFANVNNQQVVAAGTASGEVVFVIGNALAWRHRTENVIVARPFLQGERCYVGSTDDRLYALDYVKKLVLGTLDLGADVIDGPYAVGRNLVCFTADGAVHLVDAADPSSMRSLARLTVEGSNARPTWGQGIEVVADRIYATVGREVRSFIVQGSSARPTVA
jgi:hypothetical protein